MKIMILIFINFEGPGILSRINYTTTATANHKGN